MSQPMMIKKLAETVADPAERGVRMAVYRKAEVPVKQAEDIPVPAPVYELAPHE